MMTLALTRLRLHAKRAENIVLVSEQVTSNQCGPIRFIPHFFRSELLCRWILLGFIFPSSRRRPKTTMKIAKEYNTRDRYDAPPSLDARVHATLTEEIVLDVSSP